MVDLIAVFTSNTIVNWFIVFGALLGYAFLLEKIIIHYMGRFRLGIALRPDYFTSQHIQGYDVPEATEIGITAHLHNKGNEEVRILSIALTTSLAELTDLPMATRIRKTPLGITTHFDEIALQPQEQKQVALYTYKPLLLPPSVKAQNAKIEFRTTKKTVTKSIQLQRHI